MSHRPSRSCTPANECFLCRGTQGSQSNKSMLLPPPPPRCERNAAAQVRTERHRLAAEEVVGAACTCTVPISALTGSHAGSKVSLHHKWNSPRAGRCSLANELPFINRAGDVSVYHDTGPARTHLEGIGEMRYGLTGRAWLTRHGEVRIEEDGTGFPCTAWRVLVLTGHIARITGSIFFLSASSCPWPRFLLFPDAHCSLRGHGDARTRAAGKVANENGIGMYDAGPRTSAVLIQAIQQANPSSTFLHPPQRDQHNANGLRRTTRPAIQNPGTRTHEANRAELRLTRSTAIRISDISTCTFLCARSQLQGTLHPPQRQLHQSPSPSQVPNASPPPLRWMSLVPDASECFVCLATSLSVPSAAERREQAECKRRSQRGRF
jgi:hypothetical protein